jgi:glycosyltransferase involved in cell wall biosynthesis
MKKKICFIVSAPITAKAFLANHIRALSEFYDVFLVANFEKDKSSQFDDFPLKDIKNIPIPRNINLINDFKAILILKTYFNEMQFDAVHTITPKAGLLGIVAARMAGIKVRIHIFTGQVWHTKKGMFKRFLMFLDRIIVQNATHILVDGESQRQFLIRNGIVKSMNSFVLGKGSISGVDTNRFVPSETVKIEVRKEFGITKEEVVFMFLGRMNRDKGIPELTVAFNEITKVNKKARLLLVGADEDNMKDLSNKNIIDIDKVIFYGTTSQPERLLQSCDIFCLPSHREGFGTSVIEASLLEKPIICSDTYGLQETIQDNETGIRHKVKDSESLKKAMETLLNDAELRLKYGVSGRKYILENFTAQQITAEWIKFYKGILDV